MKLKKNLIKIDGRVVTYFEVGLGKPIILLPGLGSDCSLWTNVIPYLTKHYHIWAFSLPVYGTRNIHGRTYTFRTLHKLLHKLIKKFNIKKPILIGHSLGALVCLRYSAKHPKLIKKLIMVSVPLTDHSKKPPFLWRNAVDFALKSKRAQDIILYVEKNEDVLKYLLKILFPKRRAGVYAKTAQELLTHLPVKAIASCFHDLFRINFEKYTSKLKTPTLVIYGTKDSAVLDFRGTSLYNSIPNSQIISLPSEHFIPISHPNDLSHIFLKFMKNN